MRMSGSEDQKAKSDSNPPRRAQPAKISAEVFQNLFFDVVQSVRQNSEEDCMRILYKLGIQAALRVDELSLIKNSGPLQTISIGDAPRDLIMDGFGLTLQGEESFQNDPWPPVPLQTVELPSAARKSFS